MEESQQTTAELPRLSFAKSDQTPPQPQPQPPTPQSQIEINPKAPPLTDEQTQIASKALLNQFPRIMRGSYDKEIMNQMFTNISFAFLKEPKDGVYGYFKPRGSWRDVETATAEAEAVIKYQDSSCQIHIAPTGYWSPITNNERFTLDQMDVKTQEQDMALRDRAAKENVLKNQAQQRELKDRKEQIKREEEESEFDRNSLDYYTKKRVSKRELMGYIQAGKAKIQLLKKSLRKLDEEISELNKDPACAGYDDKWLENYNNARVKVGLPTVTETQIQDAPILGSID